MGKKYNNKQQLYLQKLSQFKMFYLVVNERRILAIF